jgi:hypothetical protein
MHMKRIAALSFGVLLTASAWGQHSGSAGHAGGGFSAGHASGGFSSGHSFAAPSYSRGFGNAPSLRPNVLSQRSFQYSSPAPFGGTSYGGNRRRPPYRGGGYRPYYPAGVYLVPGWLNSGFYDSGTGTSYPSADDNGQQAGAPEPQQGGPDQQAYAQPPARDAYPGDAASSPDLQQQPQVTLIFKDGRPSQVVQNYAVTRTTLYVLDGAFRREIPLDQLNLPLTEKANHEAGVDFEVPITE